MKILENSFFDKLKLSIDDLIDDEQLSIGRVGHPYIVPKGYFESLFVSINDRVDLISQPQGRRIIFIPKFKIWYGAAATFLVASVIAMWFFQSPTTTSVEDLSREDIIAYFEVEPINFSEISTAANFSEQEVTSLTDSYLPELYGADDFYSDSPDLLLEEIQQLNEK